MPTLLTGVGYIGAALLRRLADQPRAAPIVALENFFCTARQDVEAVLPPGARLIEGDVADPRDVARAFDALPVASPTADQGAARLTVFHLAAQPSASVAAKQPETTERSNLVGARVVLEAARERRARVIFGGSFRVYGDDLVGHTVSEDTPYGRVADLSHLSKIYVEQLAQMIQLPFVSVRLGVTYGRSPIMKTNPAFMTVPNLFCKLAAQGQSLRVLEDRPLAFINVHDAADALLAARDLALSLNGKNSPRLCTTVNAAPEVTSIGQLARTVQRLAESRGKSVHVEGATDSAAAYTVSSRLDGFRPRHTLANSLAEVLDFFGAGTR